jgi:hypothetical protein
MNDVLASLPHHLVNQIGSQLVAAEAAGESSTPAWLFGVIAFGILGGLLAVTMMIKADR